MRVQLRSESSVTDDKIPRTVMLYKAVAGANSEHHYGLDLARAMGFPENFMRVAEDVSRRLRERREVNKKNAEPTRLVERRKLILKLYELLHQASDSAMDDDALLAYLIHMRKEFIYRMAALNEPTKNEAAKRVGQQDTPMGDDADDEYDDAQAETLMSDLGPHMDADI